MGLAMVFPERERLGLELSPKTAAQFSPVPCGDHLSPSHRAQVASLQEKCSGVFLPLPSHSYITEHHTETCPGVVACTCLYRLPEHKIYGSRGTLWLYVVQGSMSHRLNIGVIEELFTEIL